MAKWTDTHKCGHEGTIQVFGKHEQRVYKAKLFFEDDCEACKLERIKKEIEGLDLTGSPKQIKWAESIRAEKIATAKEWIAKAQGEYKQIFANYIADNLSSTSAKWWIDNRFLEVVEDMVAYGNERSGK